MRFHFDIGSPDDRPPLLDLGLLVGGERGWCLLLATRDHQPKIGQAFPHVCIGQGVDDCAIERANDLLRRALRHPQAMPKRDVHARRADLVHSRNVRERGPAGFGHDGKGFQSVTFSMIMVRPSDARMPSAMIRPSVSVGPPVTTPAAIAARHATNTIPIVFTAVGDPVGAGVVASLARPGGNATGFSGLATEMSGKRLDILQKIVPTMSRVAMLWNDTNPGMVLRANQAQGAAAKLGVSIQSVGVHDLIDFDIAFARIESGRIDALLTLVDPFTSQHRKRVVDFAAQRPLPAVYEAREFVEVFEFAAEQKLPAIYECDFLVRDGRLMSYGPDMGEVYDRAAGLADRILRGAHPADHSSSQPASVL